MARTNRESGIGKGAGVVEFGSADRTDGVAPRTAHRQEHVWNDRRLEMSGAEERLGERIRELRRRHFGPRGKTEFARLLRVTEDEYTGYERGIVPAGEVLVRICQVTGEDLQWLLTGVSAHGTLVISGAKDRHQALLAKLARLLSESPESASPVEAFIGLLSEGIEARRVEAAAELPEPERGRLLPIFNGEELGDEPPMVERALGAWLPRRDSAADPIVTRKVVLTEPSVRATVEGNPVLSIVTLETSVGRREFVDRSGVTVLFPDMFGVWVPDDALSPVLRRNDIALVSGRAKLRPGRPVLYKQSGLGNVKCRVWLGESEGKIMLGRLDTGEEEIIATSRVSWRMEVVYRVRPAA